MSYFRRRPCTRKHIHHRWRMPNRRQKTHRLSKYSAKVLDLTSKNNTPAVTDAVVGDARLISATPGGHERFCIPAPVAMRPSRPGSEHATSCSAAERRVATEPPQQVGKYSVALPCLSLCSAWQLSVFVICLLIYARLLGQVVLRQLTSDAA